MSVGQPNKFGTFKGVFLPSTLTILGVIMYLRMGWVVGHSGLIATVVIVTLATAITFLTSLSISATATNMKVGGGGAYFMISRSLGVEAGAAIGLPLFVSQSLGISFYIVGFSESVQHLIPIEPKIISVFVLIVLTVLAYVSADLALKIQAIVFTVIVLSLVSFFAGSSDPLPLGNPLPPTFETSGFWAVFAVFFPAVTGILSGVSMSGDLKNPSQSIPKGTLAAVICGYVIYLLIPIILYVKVPQNLLIEDPLIMLRVSALASFIYLGLWGATLSSALGSLLGGPRILQALARDNIVPGFLGKSFRDDDNPHIAIVVSFSIALTGIILGDLNAIAPVLSMFFLTSYGVLNLSAGFEGLIANPSWRPRFKVKWWLSMLGAFGCFAVMFMINAGATFVALFFTVGVYYFMQRRELKARWGDVRRGILMFLARYSIYSLADMPPHAKSWRPNFLVLSGAPTSRWHLIDFANAVTVGKGILSVATVISGDKRDATQINEMEASIADYLKKKSVPALVEVSLADNVMQGLMAMIQSYGMGPLRPNTILLGDSKNRGDIEAYVELFRFINQNHRNLAVMVQGHKSYSAGHAKKIDVWWGRERQNAGLMLALGYMLLNNPDWEDSELTLKSIVVSEEEKESAQKSLRHFLADGRLDIGLEVLVHENWKSRSKLKEAIVNSSHEADLVFMGMRPPSPGESTDDYAQYYKGMMNMVMGLPTVILVVAAEKIDFANIFQS